VDPDEDAAKDVGGRAAGVLLLAGLGMCGSTLLPWTRSSSLRGSLWEVSSAADVSVAALGSAAVVLGRVALVAAGVATPALTLVASLRVPVGRRKRVDDVLWTELDDLTTRDRGTGRARVVVQHPDVAGVRVVRDVDPHPSTCGPSALRKVKMSFATQVGNHRWIQAQ